MFFRYVQNKRKRIIKKLCKDDANIKRDFSLHQFSSMFTTADKILSFLEFMAVKCFCVCMQSSLLHPWNFAKLSYQDERAPEKMQKASHAYTSLFIQMGTVPIAAIMTVILYFRVLQHFQEHLFWRTSENSF